MRMNTTSKGAKTWNYNYNKNKWNNLEAETIMKECKNN